MPAPYPTSVAHEQQHVGVIARIYMYSENAITFGKEDMPPIYGQKQYVLPFILIERVEELSGTEHVRLVVERWVAEQHKLEYEELP